MNYFRVQGVVLLGLQGISVEVECMQSRRLPYLQILGSTAGSAAEMRERVLAALESAGCRLPARRITVRFQPGIRGFSLENLDLALALAILAASGKIPSRRLEEVLVSGSLGLNGRIQAVGAEFAAQKLFARKKFSSAIVPFEESAWLTDPMLAHGGGFHTLAEVISFLTGEKRGERRSISAAEVGNSHKKWRGSDAEVRLLELAAAGGHHTLLLAPNSAMMESFASALASLRPPSGHLEHMEREFFDRLRGNGSNTARSFVRIPLQTQNEGPQKQIHPMEELLFAKNGVIYLDRIAEKEEKAIAPIFGWMESGRAEWSRLGHSFAENFEANVVAGAAPCECGGRTYGKCSCRPLELQKYRRRLERAVAGPFDLRYCFPAESEKKAVDLDVILGRIAGARARMRERQGILNGKLGAEGVLGVKSWQAKAALLLRSLSLEASLDTRAQTALAKVALSVSDLRGGEEVLEQDVFEARHYSCFA